MKNPFSTKGAMATLVNVGVGGAANVAVDSIFNAFPTLANLEETYKNAIKIGIGVLGGTMSKNDMVHAAVDGVAVVGVSDLMKSFIGQPTSTEAASGLPSGTIGRVALRGRRGAHRAVRGTGALANGFMGK